MLTPEEIKAKMEVIYQTKVRPQIKAYEDAKKAGTLKPLPSDSEFNRHFGSTASFL